MTNVFIALVLGFFIFLFITNIPQIGDLYENRKGNQQ